MRRRAQERQVAALTQPLEGFPSSHDEWLGEPWRAHLPFPATAPIYAEAKILAATPRDAHIHDALEVGVVLSGELGRFSEGFAFRARPGDVWLVPMWEPHGWEVACEDTRVVQLHFLPEFLGSDQIGDASWLAAFAVAPSLRPRVTDPRRREQVMAIARELWEEIREQQYGWVTAERAGLLRLLTILYRAWEQPKGDHVISTPGFHPSSLARLMPVITAVQHRPGRAVAVSEAASLCNLSPRQFHRIFSQTMGVGFQRFCLRARLAHVARLLTATDLPVEAVARETGFSDLAHLHRHFVKHYGCTAGSFRRRIQNAGQHAAKA